MRSLVFNQIKLSCQVILSVAFLSWGMAWAEDTITAGAEFRDCADCPEMVVVPAGRFMMGSSDNEDGRYDNEEPQHEVTISNTFALGKYPVTLGEYRRFAEATGREHDGSCDVDPDYDAVWKTRAGYGWWNPGFDQTERDPVVCVNWSDAVNYVEWLSKMTGETYRMPTEAEWEYAARAGSQTAYYWGSTTAAQCDYANGADVSARSKYPKWKETAPCKDGYVTTSPVGTFKPNAFGLYDMLGNAWQLTQDCFTEDYDGAPSDGSVWQSKDCEEHIIRGGSWGSNPGLMRSALRGGSPYGWYNYSGFRLAKDL